VDDEATNAVPNTEGVWAGPNGDSSEHDNGTSDTSETSTTIQADAGPDTKDAPAQLQPDDDSSAPPSTSQSLKSHHEAPIESPRTSLDDEEAIAKNAIEDTRGDKGHGSVGKGEGEEEEHGSSSSSNSAEDEYGTSTADTLLTEGPPDKNDVVGQAASEPKEDTPKSPVSRTESITTPPSTAATTATVVSCTNTYQLDTALLDELFPPQKNETELDDAPEDPICSTSERKAWYRLTRKQTMREFNSGNSDDSYVRVTWPGSQVRSEVHKTVARWAREDRMSGTGPGAGASFYWDTPAPVEPRIPKGHQRTKTSIPTQRIAAPMRQSLPPVATNTAAAFNWDSPTSTIDPWKQDKPDLQPAILPVTHKPTTLDNERTQESRTVSIDLTHGVGEMRGSASVISLETPTVASTIPPPPPTTTSADSWGDSSVLDTNTIVPEKRADVPEDDDDDWGEMISSPTVSTPVSAFPSSIFAPPDNTVSTLDPAPETSSVQDPSADAMHTASIVRLRSTISPTSAIFGRKSFVPLGAEQGPIGPGILKPVKQTAASTPEKPKQELSSKPLWRTLPKEQEIPHRRDAETAYGVKTEALKPRENGAVDNSSATRPSTLESGFAEPVTPPRTSIQTQPTTDSWADADFSIFESAPPTATAHPKPKHESADHFSDFQTPPRSNSAASSAKTFTRSSPPRVVTPPAIQPLTGATNSAQRRKNEEERIIREILAGLPDLSYMLR
jgi:hypothetical protein